MGWQPSKFIASLGTAFTETKVSRCFKGFFRIVRYKPENSGEYKHCDIKGIWRLLLKQINAIG
ncbi:MAG: hypothetical protein IJ088_04195, partial [Clostridia bacterium]|nr:hypothetical protein [Clostridia bacterium]